MSYTALIFGLLALPMSVVLRWGVVRGIREDGEDGLGWVSPPGWGLTSVIGGFLLFWVFFANALWDTPYEQAAVIGLLWTYTSLGWHDLHRGYIPYAQAIPLFWAGLLFSPLAGLEARVLGAVALWLLLIVGFTYTSWRRGKDTTADGDLVMAAASGAWIGYSLAAPYMVLAGFLGIAVHLAIWYLQGREEAPFGLPLALSMPIILLVSKLFPLSFMFYAPPVGLPGS